MQSDAVEDQEPHEPNEEHRWHSGDQTRQGDGQTEDDPRPGDLGVLRRRADE